MKFRDYFLAMPVERRVEFAKLVGAPVRSLYNVAYQERSINAKTAILVEKHTLGMVRVEELRPDMDWAVIRKRK